MKIKSIVIALLTSLVPFCAYTAWEVAQPEAAIPSDPFFQAGTQPNTAFIPKAYGSVSFPNQYATLGQAAPVFAVSVSGSLKENIERIMGRYHWKVVWKAPYDYNFDGKVTGSSLPNVVEKLLKPFPLQAVMYMSNRTIAITPRYKT